MNASFVHSIIVFIVFCFPAILRAQTVESVLRALQERKLALEWRESWWGPSVPGETEFSPIVWRNVSSPYPRDDTIYSLSDVIAVLNQASIVFDEMKGKFVAYDDAARRFVNLEGQVEHDAHLPSASGAGSQTAAYLHRAFLDLPSVGTFDADNWRQKLKLLASNINQLRCLEWPLFARYANSVFLPLDRRTKAAEWTVNFPHLVPPGGNSSTENPASIYTGDHYLVHNSSSKSAVWGADMLSVFSWAAFGYAYVSNTSPPVGVPPDAYNSFDGYDSLICALGVRGKLGPGQSMQLPGGMTPLIGRIDLFTGAVISDGGDLLEYYINHPPGDRESTGLYLGKLTKLASLPAPLTGDILGDYNGNGAAGDARGSYVTNSLNSLQLSKPEITGSLVPLPPVGDDFTRYCFSIGQSQVKPRFAEFTPHSQHSFDVGLIGVAVPNFTEIILDNQEPLASALPGTIEPSVRNFEMVRVHVGRGKDGCQMGWLGTRMDGFGSMIFHGSPRAFDLVYEEDYTKFGTDLPLDGMKYDSPEDLTALQKAGSSWQSRFDYIAQWFAPRLKQVKGRDVLVTIDYPSSYRKVLNFYWAEGATKLQTGLYQPALHPFKTVTVFNPTGPAIGAGFPTNARLLRVSDNGERFYDFEFSGGTIINGVPVVALANSEITFTFSSGRSAGEKSWEQVIKIPFDGAVEMGPWLVTMTTRQTVGTGQNAVTKQNVVKSTLSWSPGRSPLERDRSELLSADVNDGAQLLSCEWSQWPGYGTGILTKATFSGSSAWEGKGRQISWNPLGWRTEYKEPLGQYLHKISEEISGNVRTRSMALGVLASGSEEPVYNTFRSESAVYQDWHKKETWSIGGQQAAVFNYSQNGQLASALYPGLGGYQESFGWSQGAHGWTFNHTSGWGTQYASGLTSSVQLSLRGDVTNLTVATTDGVNLVEDVGSNFTGWGAPRTMTHLRGDETTINYEESGVNWGLPLTTVDAAGRSTGATGHDWLSRVTGISTGFESFTADYSDLLKPKFFAQGGASFQSTLSSTGELQTIEGRDGIASYRVEKNGDGFVQIDDQPIALTAALNVDASGILKKVGNGLGSRGAKFDFGVENGEFYTETTPLDNHGDAKEVSVRTFYDQKGRVRKITRPSETGVIVTDQWDYDDAKRSVTYTPGAGPLRQTTKTVVAVDGSDVTVSENGMERWRIRREVEGQTLSQVTERKSGSSGGKWTEVSRDTVNPTAGTTTFTPWGVTTNSVTLTQPPLSHQGTATLVDGGTGTSLFITLQNGLPSAITGTVEGVAVDMNSISFSSGRLTGMSGNIAGQSTGLAIGSDRRLSNLWGPGTNQIFQYGPGYAVTVNDTEQDVTSSVLTDDVGNLVSFSSGRSLAVNATETTDTDTGSETKLNGSVTIRTNLQGSLLGKNYTGGITESYALNSDGSMAGISVQGPGGSAESVTIDEQLASRTRSYSDGLTITEGFYDSGERNTVSAPGDGREFLYQSGKLLKETHTAGIWNGWQVERLPDAKGRLGTLRISGGGVVRETTFGYDGFGLSGSAGLGVNATYGRHSSGQLGSLTRGALVSTWGRDTMTGRLSSFTNAGLGSGFAYSFPDRDKRGRVTTRYASLGVPWTALSYDGIDQLQEARVGGRMLTYNYDGRGNRSGQGTPVKHTINGLDQISGRKLVQRGFGVSGAVALQSQPPQPTLQVFHPLNTPAGEALTVQPWTGSFYGFWNLPEGWNGGAAGRIDALVRGTLPGAGLNGSAAVADAEFHLLVPPAQESPLYDGSGRMKEDAFWSYTWDGAGRLTRMVRKSGVLPEPDATTDELSFGYDADGRRTVKRRTTLYQGGRSRVEESRVLWSGWLPVMEERTRNGQTLGRRFFQWGADQSGSFEGAGGIGGLVAIREESASGQTLRVLLPVQDGLGNVTAVLDAADGHVVARHDTGPFGEPLGEYGETDACPFRFQTKWYDAESEQYYFGYRYYSPRLGRWLSRDPLGEAGGMNLYAYCGNDPVNRHDPLGLREVLGDSPGEFDVIIQPDGSFAVSGQRILQMGAGLLNAYDEVPNRAELAVINYEQTGNPKYLDEPSLRSLAEVGFAHVAITGAHDPRGMSEYLANTFGGLAAGGGRAPVATPTFNFTSTPIMRRTMGWRDVAESTPPGNPVGGRSSNWSGKQRFDSSGLSPTQVDTAILKSIRRKSGAIGTPTRQIAATADQVEFILSKATYWQRNILAADPRFAGLTANKMGTAIHSAVSGRIRSLGIADLAINQRLYGNSQFISPATGRPYSFRIPDYRLGSTILDIKPVGTPLSGPQVIDFMNFGNTRDVRFIFYAPW